MFAWTGRLKNRSHWMRCVAFRGRAAIVLRRLACCKRILMYAAYYGENDATFRMAPCGTAT